MLSLPRHLTVALLLPAYLAISACGSDADREPVALRVMSYTIGQGQDFSDGPPVIRSQNPDLLALQLAGNLSAQSIEEDQLATIAEAAGMPYYLFAPVYESEAGQPVLAIFSRYPLGLGGVEPLPVTGDREPRIALWVEVEVPGIGHLLFVNTQLEAYSIEQDRLNQVVRLKELFADSIVTPAGKAMPGVVVLAGDFGADTGNLAIDTLESEFTDGFRGATGHTFAAAVPRNAYKKIYRLSSASLETFQSWVLDESEPSDSSVRSPTGCSVIAHRGASAYLPEHTSAAYHLAIEQEADYIEPDVVLSKDGVPVVRHENRLSLTTDIAQLVGFADRKTTRILPSGAEVEDWYSEEFTYAEIATLRSIERYPVLRPDSAFFDRVYPLMTLQHAIDLWQQARANGSDIRLYPEIKVAAGYEPEGFDGLQVVLDTLTLNGLTGPDDGVLFQSFDAPTLQRAAQLTDLPLVQYMTHKTPEELEALIASGELNAIAAYADGIGVGRSYVYTNPPPSSGEEPQLSNFVESAHAAGLFVHVFIFRAENQYLPVEFRSESEPRGDLAGFLRTFFSAGVDGVIVDEPDIGRAACNRWLADDYRPVIVDFEF